MDLQHIKKAVQIEGKLQKCRDSVKFIWGDNYKVKIQNWIDTINRVMKKNNSTDALMTAYDMVEPLTKKGSDSAFTIMVIMTAACEILEPSE